MKRRITKWAVVLLALDLTVVFYDVSRFATLWTT